MEKATLLNIPNYYSSFYIKGLCDTLNIKFKPNLEFERWNFLPFIILDIKNKLIVIDNADPICVRRELYEKCDYYFLTNKIKSRSDFQREKLKPLFPHYPINALRSYFYLFGENFLKKPPKKNYLKNLYVQYKRPILKDYSPSKINNAYIFFAGSIWRDEPVANLQRAEFIKACRENEDLEFEGGLVPRSDGMNQGYDDLLCNCKFSVRDFSKNTYKSYLTFNNPAVLGALSWRVAEVLNMGVPLISLPFMVELPVYPIDRKEIEMVSTINELDTSINYLLQNKSYRNKLSTGAKQYFNKYCTPLKQVNYILNFL